MVDFGSGHLPGVALFAKTEGLSNFETAGASEANAYRGACGLFRKSLTGYAIIPKERLSGIALAKPEKRSPGPKDAVYG